MFQARRSRTATRVPLMEVASESLKNNLVFNRKKEINVLLFNL